MKEWMRLWKEWMMILAMKQRVEISDFAQFIMDMGFFDSLEPATLLAEQLEFLKPGEVKGIVAFPLAKAPVTPDLVVIYGTPAQMTRLVYAYTRSHSRVIHSNTSF